MKELPVKYVGIVNLFTLQGTVGCRVAFCPDVYLSSIRWHVASSMP